MIEAINYLIKILSEKGLTQKKVELESLLQRMQEVTDYS